MVIFNSYVILWWCLSPSGRSEWFHGKVIRPASGASGVMPHYALSLGCTGFQLDIFCLGMIRNTFIHNHTHAYTCQKYDNIYIYYIIYILYIIYIILYILYYIYIIIMYIYIYTYDYIICIYSYIYVCMILLYDYVDITTKWQEMLLRPTMMCCQHPHPLRHLFVGGGQKM